MNIVLAVVICLLLVGALIFISINNKANMATENSSNDNYVNEEVPSPTLGEIVKTGDTVAMNYTGRLEDGTVFDSNVALIHPWIRTL